MRYLIYIAGFVCTMMMASTAFATPIHTFNAKKVPNGIAIMMNVIVKSGHLINGKCEYDQGPVNYGGWMFRQGSSIGINTLLLALMAGKDKSCVNFLFKSEEHVFQTEFNLIWDDKTQSYTESQPSTTDVYVD